MTTRVDVEVSGDSCLDLFPLEIHPDGDVFLVGRRGASYLAVNELGIRVIDMFRQNLSPSQIKTRVATESPGEAIALRELLETLLAAGLVRAVSGKPVEPTSQPRVPTWWRLEKRHIAWLFAWPMVVLYVVLVAAGAGLLIAHPYYLAGPAALLVGGSYALTAAVATLLIWANVVKHEAAHVVAGRFVGVDTYCSLGHRLFFPVLQADLTDLWLVDRAQRYIAYSAGIVSDLLVAAGVVIILWLNDRGQVALGPDVLSVVRLLLVLVGAGVVWQFNVFLRTDVYYILTNALGHRNLAADARAWVMAGIRRRLTKSPHHPGPPAAPAHIWAVPVYAVVSLVGAGLLSMAGVFYLIGALRFLLSGTPTSTLAAVLPESGSVARVVMGFSLLLNIALLGASMRRERRQRHVTYRLVSPADL